jgi:hypothetical protein
MRIYKQGLKPLVQVELIRSSAKITNLNLLIAKAIRINNNLFKL